MYYLLYEITNLVNGKTYIGQHITKNINDGYMGSGRAIVRAIKKYGKENFKKEILLYAKNEVALNFFEKALVTPEFIELDTNYNLREGGGSKGRPSKQSVAKQAAALRGRKREPEHVAKTQATKKSWSPERKAAFSAKRSTIMKGRKLSPETISKIQETRRKKGTYKHSLETIAKISAAHKGKKLSLETIKKMSVALKGKKRCPRSPETKAKLSAANKGKKLPPETKAKITATLKNRWQNPEFKIKMSEANKGRKHSPETKAKISAALKGKSKKLNQQLLTCNELSVS
jgi:hypothetical protein